VIIVTISTPDGTGAPRMAYLYAAAARRAGHRVIVACGRLPGVPDAAEGPMSRDFAEADLEVRTVPGLEHRYDGGAVSTLAEIAGAEAAGAMVAFQFRDQMAALLAAGRSAVPCVISAQNRHEFVGSWPARRVKSLIFARALRRHAALAIATSDAVRRELVDFGVEPRRIHLLPNAIDVAGFPRVTDPGALAAVRRNLGVAERAVMLVNVGRIDVQKGQDDLLRAFADADPAGRDLHLVLVGEPTTTQARRMARYHRRLVAFVKERGLEERVTWAGWRDDVPALLGAADAYVHAARWEGWPLAVMEALAAGRPTIFTDCSGHPPDFENGREGYVVPTGDPAALADAIGAFLALSPEQRGRVGADGRRYAEEHYDIGVVGPRFVELVERVLTDR
jgi:glycosyltransferase involved in cell wall biosynthesis